MSKLPEGCQFDAKTIAEAYLQQEMLKIIESDRIEPQWISIDDELPDDDNLKVCRIAKSDTGEHHGIALSRYYSPDNMSDENLCWCFEFSSTQPLKISHWMSLPEVN